ncbi:trypsin-like peptidase domain-containing protein [Flammeovirgaceae bacterium SG7u.111]|nr:trypsin-like peptidase domain-containing protein [Flammeovirgaceae bacterium SG7u.132]WPO35293.1 trypsin-like peptidase domain-containing protein [Flammeovirgaceae bacterium SG7u.111]
MKSKVYSIFLSVIAGFLGAYIFSLIEGSSENGFSGLKADNIQLISNDSAEGELHISENLESEGAHGNLPSVNIDFVKASQQTRQSVVYIKTIAGGQYQGYSWFDYFFSNRMTERQVTGSGSGVIFTSNGYIVTNNHVIDGADEIQVIYNKKSYKAGLVGHDPSTDLAVLKIEATDLPAIKIGSSRELSVGDWVLAVGNPFNLESTVTAGIVSAKGRRINVLEDLFPIESFIQTDAAINPGNSGGALVNGQGELVGINTAILSRTGSYAGYGFAVPSDIVTKIVEDLRKYGEVQKAFLGVSALDIDEDISDKLGTNDLDGVVVNTVDKEGAAAKVGMSPGDVISEIDGKSIKSMADFDEILSYYRPGDKVSVKYKRAKETFVREVILTNIEGTTSILRKITYDSDQLGALFEVVPKIERARLGIEGGIRVKKVVGNGLIYKMDINEGFVIVAINNYLIERPEDLEEILSKIRGRVILQGISKNGEKKYYSYRF